MTASTQHPQKITVFLHMRLDWLTRQLTSSFNSHFNSLLSRKFHSHCVDVIIVIGRITSGIIKYHYANRAGIVLDERCVGYIPSTFPLTLKPGYRAIVDMPWWVLFQIDLPRSPRSRDLFCLVCIEDFIPCLVHWVLILLMIDGLELEPVLYDLCVGSIGRSVSFKVPSIAIRYQSEILAQKNVCFV